MPFKTFRSRVSAPLKAFDSSIDTLRIEGAHEDVVALYQLAEVLSRAIAGRTFADLSSKDLGLLQNLDGNGRQDVLMAQWQERQMMTLLKALYAFSNIFIGILLGEVSRGFRGKMSVSMHKFIMNPSVLPTDIVLDKLLPAYCLATYRNKIIAHHDFRRTHGYARDAEGNYRLSPLHDWATGINLSHLEAKELEQLRAKYASDVPELASERNQLVQLRILFYNVPIGSRGSISGDRQRVNALVEEYGCPSMTRDELMVCINNFAADVSQAVAKTKAD